MHVPDDLDRSSRDGWAVPAQPWRGLEVEDVRLHLQHGSEKRSWQLRWPWRSQHTTRRRHGRSQAHRSGGAMENTETIDGELGLHVSLEEGELQIDGDEKLERRVFCDPRWQPKWPEPAEEARQRWQRC